MGIRKKCLIITLLCFSSLMHASEFMFKHLEKERGRGVMIEKDGSMFVVYDSGKQEPLLTE